MLSRFRRVFFYMDASRDPTSAAMVAMREGVRGSPYCSTRNRGGGPAPPYAASEECRGGRRCRRPTPMWRRGSRSRGMTNPRGTGGGRREGGSGGGPCRRCGERPWKLHPWTTNAACGRPFARRSRAARMARDGSAGWPTRPIPGSTGTAGRFGWPGVPTIRPRTARSFFCPDFDTT